VPNVITSVLSVTFCPSMISAMKPLLPSDQRFSARTSSR